jgi:DNA primase
VHDAGLFEKLRGEIDLAQLAARYTELRASGRASVGRCPHPDHEDQSPSFHVYPDRRFRCYGCGWHGDVVDFWVALKGLRPGIEAARDLAREYGVSVPEMSAESRERAEESRRLEAKYLEQATECHEALSRHSEIAEWWAKRGFSEELTQCYLLGANADGTEAIVPFFHRGRVQGLIRRRLEGEPKYMLPKKEQFPKGYRPLFIPGPVKGETFVVEGYVDALALAALGYGAVAVGGTHANDEQLKELKRLPGPLYVLPDADEEGQKAARGWARKLYPKALLCPPNYEKENDVEE